MAAMLRLPTKLLVADESKCGAKLFVFDDRGLRDLANFVEGPICQFDAAVTDCQPTVGIINARRRGRQPPRSKSFWKICYFLNYNTAQHSIADTEELAYNHSEKEPLKEQEQ